MEIRGKPVLRNVIRLDSIPMVRANFTDEGYLIDTPIVTSTGIFEYTNPDGSIRRELRIPDEVFNKDSLASYLGKPIIISHDAGLVTKDNVAEHEIGTILTKGFRDGDNVRAKIVIHDTDEMKQSGLKELSLGYNLDLDETPGTWNGEHYDAIQRNIRINHLALVREARAGEQARLNIDSKDAMKGAKAMSKKRKKTRRADGILSPDELKKAIAEYRKNHPAPGKADEEDDPNEVPVPAKAKAVEKDCDDKGKFASKKQGDAEEENEELKETIAHQDEDIQSLLDIIDTLLAEKEFDEADEPEKDPELEKEDEDDEELPEDELTEDDDEDEELVEDDDEDEEELVEDDDEDDEELTEDDDDDLEDEEFSEDDDEDLEDEEVAEDEDDDDIPDRKPADLKAGEVMNADAVDKIVRARVKIGIAGNQLNMDGLNNMSIKRAKKRIIKAVRPNVRLDGKSNAYINAMFDLACEELKKANRKGTDSQRRQMFNKDSKSVKRRRRSDSAEAHRDRMIARTNKRNKK